MVSVLEQNVRMISYVGLYLYIEEKGFYLILMSHAYDFPNDFEIEDLISMTLLHLFCA